LLSLDQIPSRFTIRSTTPEKDNIYLIKPSFLVQKKARGRTVRAKGLSLTNRVGPTVPYNQNSTEFRPHDRQALLLIIQIKQQRSEIR